MLPGLIEAFGGRAWIISKCGDRVRRRTLAWLDHHDFYARTGLPRENVRFCGKRPEKARHCAELGITHMIDDRRDVHHAIREIVPYRYLFDPAKEPAKESVHRPAAKLEGVRRIPDWPSAGEVIRRDIPAGRIRPATPR